MWQRYSIPWSKSSLWAGFYSLRLTDPSAGMVAAGTRACASRACGKFDEVSLVRNVGSRR